MQRSYLAVLATAGLLALLPDSRAAAAAPASSIGIVPPPGLYQIDTDATHALVEPGAVTETHVDGATGATRQRQTVRGQSAEHAFPGTGRQTQCLKPYKNVPGLDQALRAACSRQANRIVDDHTMINTAECPGARTTTKITKLSDRTWDFETRIETMPTSQGPANPMAGMEAMLRLAATHGETAAKRQEAQKMLESMPKAKDEYERERVQAMAEMRAARDGAKEPEVREAAARALANMERIGAPVNQLAVTRQRWTRIGNCSDAQ